MEAQKQQQQQQQIAAPAPFAYTCPRCLYRTRTIVCKRCCPTPLPRLPGYGQGLLKAQSTERCFYLRAPTPAQPIWAIKENEVPIAPLWMSHREVEKKRSRRDWKPAPKGENIPLSMLGFRPMSVEEKEERGLKSEPRVAPPSWAPFEERCLFAEEEGWTWMRIAGLIMPCDNNGMFCFYSRKQTETRKQWRSRLYKMRKAHNFSQKIMREEGKLDLPLWEQLRRAAQTAGGLYNPFSKLTVSEPPEWVQNHKPTWASLVRNPPGTRTRKSFVNCGPKTNKGWSFIEARLALKKVRAALQDNWREARNLRREKMERVLLKFENHRVRSLAGALQEALTTKAAYDHYRKFDRVDPGEIQGEMDKPESAQGTAAAPETEQSSNVVVQKQVGESVGSSLPSGGARKKKVFSDLSLAKSTIEDKTLHDRFYTIHQFNWENGSGPGEEVLSLEIPKDILESKKFKDSPNYAMFSRHMYWNGDLEIEIIANTNVRQFGQLQFSFYYADRQDALFKDLRNNIYTASQRLHSLLTANTCNTVKISIPFEYIFPILQIGRNTSDGARSLGVLKGLVIVPITANAQCPQDASVSVGVRFIGNEFAGMVPRSIAEGQMLPALASIIAVKSLIDKNRDNPTLTSPGIPVIPVNTSSWCLGNGQSEFSNILRLNPHCMLPYPEGRIPSVDEMTVNYVKQTFGMIDKKKWVGSDQRGQALWSWNATPLDDLTVYPKVTYQSKITSVVPPVGVLTSLFAYWRGAMELRIDLVAATEISGSLLIAYVPKVDKSFQLTMEQAFSCSHSIHHITENRQINFTIPFLASHMFWPRRATLSNEYPTYDAPGAIFLFCYNQLKVNCTIPDECNLIFYLRGGEDFEVAVPACPSLGTAFWPNIYLPSTTQHRVVSVEGYTPYYSGWWHNAYFTFDKGDEVTEGTRLLFQGAGTDLYISDQDNTIYFPVLRYGSISDHIAQFRLVGFNFGPDPRNRFCYVEPPSSWTSSNIRVEMTSGNLPKFTLNEAARGLIIWQSDKFVYGTPIPSKPETIQYIVKICNDQKTGGNVVTPESVIAGIYCLMAYKAFGRKPTEIIKTEITSTFNYTPSEVILPVVSPTLVSADGDEKTTVIAPAATPQESAPGNASMEIMGEKFGDLKDLCRRYQLYASDSIKIEKLWKRNNWRTIVIRFPVVPQGLDLDAGRPEDIKEYWNRTRDGVIPLVASGYRFFTGGIRFRICLNVKPLDERFEMRGKIFVQHRPNVISTGLRVTAQGGSSLGTDDLELPGYAAYHQFEDLNNVLSVEVPFYMPSIRTYLQRPGLTDLAKRWSNLGELVVGLTVFSQKEAQFDYDIYYSLADDARFSVFVGFPPMIDIANIPQEDPNKVQSTWDIIRSEEVIDNADDYFNAIRQQISDKLPRTSDGQKAYLQIRKFLRAKKSDRSKILEDLRDMWFAYQMFEGLNEGEAPGIISSIKEAVGLGKTEQVLEKADKILDSVDEQMIKNLKDSSENLKDISEKAKSWFPRVDDITNSFKKYVDLVINAVTNLVHVLLNLNIKSIVTAIISFLVQLKVVAWDVTASLMSSIHGLFANLFTRASTEHEPDVIVANAPNDEEDDKALSGYISTLIAGVGAIFAYIPQFCKARKDQLGMLIMDGLRKFSGTANNLFTFIKNNLVAAKRIGEWMFSDHPNVKRLAFLQGEHENVYVWAKEVLEYTDPRNENKVFTSPVRASKVYALAGQASILYIKLLDLNLNGSQCNLLKMLIDKIGKLKDRLSKAHLAPPVRFEPFICELTGKTGIGKSELFKTLPYDLFKYMGMKHEGELVYHRQIGNPYWNNLKNQPVLVVDEKFPIKAPEFSGVQLAELFQIKSSCVFNPPMADIPDKNTRYNPILAFYGSNKPFPQLDGVLTPDAVNRRRDVLVEVRMKTEYTTRQIEKYDDLPVTVKSGPDFNWLEFRFKGNVCSTDVGPGAWSAWIEYPAFKEQLCGRFKVFFVNEEKKFRKQLNLINSLMPDEGEVTVIQDLFNQKWFDDLETTSAPSADSHNIRKLRDNYQAAYKFSKEVKDKFLLAKIALADFLNDQETVNKLLTEFRMQHPNAPTGLDLKDATADVIARERNLALQQCQAERVQEEEVLANAPLDEEPITDKEILRKMICPHKNLADAIQANTTKWSFDYIQNSWCLDFEECRTELIGSDYQQGMSWTNLFNKVYGHRKEMYSWGPNCDQIFIKHQECEICDDCPFKSKDDRRLWVSNNILSNCQVMAELKTGQPMQNKLPAEFLESIYPQVKKQEEHDKLKKEVKETKGWLASLKESFYKIEWRKWLKRLTIFIAVFGLIGAIIGFWRSGINEDTITAAELGVGGAVATFRIDSLEAKADLAKKALSGGGEMATSGDIKVARAKQSTVKVIDKQILANMGIGILNKESVKQKLRRNTFFLSVGASKLKGSRCLGICGQFALIVAHYREAWEKFVKQHGDEIMWYVAGIDGQTSLVNLKYSDLKFYKINNSSLEIMQLPYPIKPFRDIRHLFCKREYHGLLNQSGTMVNFEVNGSVVDLNLYKLNYNSYFDLQVNGCELWGDFKVHSAYEYSGFHGSGQCGSVLLADRCQQPIIGMHVAGAKMSEWGYSELVYQEMFDCLGNCPSSLPPLGEGDTSTHYVHAEVLGLGKVGSKFAHQERGQTRIVPSMIGADPKFSHNFTKYAEPAILSPNDPRNLTHFSPMKEGCKHHGKPLFSFNKEHIELAKLDVRDMILANCKPQRTPGLLTVDQAVGGLPHKDGYEHMEFSTSEGYPFVGMRPPGAHNKRWLFEFDEDNKYKATSELLQNCLKGKWEQRLRNEIPATVFTDCLKDAVIPLEKVCQPGKTRIFSISPVDFTIQQRQCTLDFSVAYMASRRNLEHMIGCNPNSIEWTWLANDLLKMSNNILTGDYSKYGDSLPCEFIHAAFEIISEWYRFHGCDDEQLHQQLKIFPYEIGNSIHLMFDHLYACVCGQPSGNSLTVIINSIANSLYLRVAWLSIMKNTKFCSLTDFSRNVVMFSYGDDLIVALSDSVKEMFNGITLHSFFDQYGLKFTNANKSDVMVPYAKLSEAEFLKAGFAPHPSRTQPQLVLAPLQQASIENTVLWVWSDSFGKTEPGSPTFESMSIQVCEDSVRNAFGRGPAYYSAWASKLQIYWLQKGVKFSVDTWEQLDRKIFELGENVNPWSIKTLKHVLAP